MGPGPSYAASIGAIHIDGCDLEEAARRGRGWAGPVVAVRADRHELDLRVEERFARRLPERAERAQGWTAWVKRRWRRPPVEPAEVRTFAISPPPVATDAYSHPIFTRLIGGLEPAAFAVGDRAIVLEADFTGVLRDEPAVRARVVAAFDRTADRVWATAATVDELHLALLDRDRWDAALDELRWRRALDPRGLLARLPPDRIGALPAVVGRLDPRERTAFMDGAVRHLAGTDRGDLLATLVRSLFDFVQLQQLEPLLLLLDRARPAEARQLDVARIRLARILREQPARAASFARLAAHLGLVDEPPRAE